MEQRRDDKTKHRTGRPRPWTTGRWLGTRDDRDPQDYGEIARSWGATSWPVTR